jgi:hypothetical protein
MRGWRTLLGASLVVAVVWAPLALGRQAKGPQDKNKAKAADKNTKAPDKSKPKPPPPPPVLETKDFEVSRADLEEVRQTLETVFSGRATGQKPRLAANPRTKTLFARATAKDLETIGDIIAVLDNPPDKPLPEGSSGQLFRLQYARANEVASVVTRLGISTLPIVLPKMNALYLAGNDGSAKDIKVVIEKMDVPKAAPSKTTKPTKPVKKGR